jgi:hypothetical protein
VVALSAADVVEVPAMFVAATWKLYVVPPVRLACRYDVVSASTDATRAPLRYTLYPVMAEPPSDGAVHETAIDEMAMLPRLGASISDGTVRARAESVDESVAPEALYAETYTSYVVPFVRPVIVVGDVEVEPDVQSVYAPDEPARK